MTKTCPKGCHTFSETMDGWFDGYEYLGGPQYGPQYCAASDYKLLPGGEVVEMVSLELAVGTLLDGCGWRGDYCGESCGSDKCKELWREHLRKQAKETDDVHTRP